MSELVSIIIPTYNGLPWLKQAIDSALNQTYKYCEIIVIDDGSIDDTKHFIRKVYSSDVRYYYQTNKGLSASRNYGLEIAKGEYIQFLDSDDLIFQNKIKSQINFLKENRNIDVVYSDCRTFKNDNLDSLSYWYDKNLYCNGNIFLDLIKKSFILPHMPLSRKSVLLTSGGYNTKLDSCIDYDFWLRVSSKNAKFHFLDDGEYVLYRIRTSSLSTSSVRFAENGLNSLRKLEKKILDMNGNAYQIYQDGIGNWLFRIGKSMHENGKYFYGIKHMFKGLMQNKSDFKYKFSLLTLALFFKMSYADKILLGIKKIIKGHKN